MPTRPEIKTLNAKSADIINAVTNEIGGEYASAVPRVTAGDLDSLRAAGMAINSFPSRQNMFLTNLVNRIARVIITSRLYQNPWSVFKKGLLEYGETVEEIFVSIADPNNYDPEKAESDQYKRVIPDVRSVFHTMNYQKFYKTTIQDDSLKLAFLSWDGVTDLIGKIIDALYTAANYDEFTVMKYMIAREALDGGMYGITVPEPNSDNARAIAGTFKAVSNQLTFMSTKYNYAGVSTYSDKSSQWLIISADFAATMDVDVLATSFNSGDAEFMGNRILIDGFDKQDNARLAKIFKDVPGFAPFTQAELSTLAKIPAVLIDESWMMIFDNLYNMTEKYNAEGLYWNYWYHTWKTFSVSPFSTAVVFTTDTPAVTAVAINPSTATVGKGQSINLTAKVTATGLASAQVTWAIKEANSTSTISNGKLDVARNEPNATLTITATSTVDTTKSGTATITVA